MTDQIDSVTATSADPESPTEKYLRQIRNVLVAAFVIFIVGGVTTAIIYGVASAHAHEAQAKLRCQNQGGIWVEGKCQVP